MQEARTIAIGDFNRDGKIDLLAAAVGAPDSPNHESQVVWYENPGEPAKQEWTRRIISKELPAAIHGHPVDLDRDGDLDVVMAHGMRIEADPEIQRHQVVWYENIERPGAVPSWKRHKVGLMPYAFEATAGDIDGDGDLDIAATAWSKGDRSHRFPSRQFSDPCRSQRRRTSRYRSQRGRRLTPCARQSGGALVAKRRASMTCQYRSA